MKRPLGHVRVSDERAAGVAGLSALFVNEKCAGVARVWATLQLVDRRLLVGVF